MLNFTVGLFILSLVFSVAASAAFALRRRLFGSREGIMYPVWVILFAIAVLPIRIDIPASDTADWGSVPESHIVILEPDWLTVTKSGVITSDGKFVPGESGNEVSTLIIGQQIRRFLAASAETIGDVAAVLFILWIAGAVISFSRVLVRYWDTRRLFLANSRVCTDRRVLALCDDIRSRLKIKQKVSVRVFDIEALVSPCVVGVFKPVLFVDARSLSADGEGLRCVLTHELTHIKRFDMAIKLFCMLAASVHWFNPMSRRVVDAVLEDCELSCDYGVLEAYGSAVSGVYMGAILDIAQRYSEEYRRMTGERYASGLFVLRPTAATFLRRRYANMKNYKKDRLSVCLVVVFCAVSLAFTTAVMSACSDVSEKSLGSAIKLDAPFDAMMRAYYDLGNDDSITPEMIDGIKSLTVVAVEYGERLTAEFVVNDEFTARALLPVVPANYYNSVVLAGLEAANLEDTLSQDRFKAFYTLGNEIVSECLCNSQYDEAMREYIASTHLLSALERYDSFYLLDPYSTERELNDLRAILDTAGLYDAWIIGSDNLDCSSLGYFENLERIEFVGITPVGFTFSGSVTVSVTPVS